MDAINAVFAKLEAAFPLKYRRAFPSVEQENVAKAQWLETLKAFTPARIVRAAQKAIETTRFFPDLADIRELCRLKYDEYGLKEPLQAYYEACNAGSQSRDWPWSHPAVFLAAQASGWLLIRGEPQEQAYPVFERNYEILCNRVLNGEDLEAEILQGLENQAGKARLRASLEAADVRQQQQMRELGVNPEGGRAEFLKLKATLKPRLEALDQDGEKHGAD